MLIQGLGLGKDIRSGHIGQSVPFKPCFCVAVPTNLHLTDVVSFFTLTKSGILTVL